MLLHVKLYSGDLITLENDLFVWNTSNDYFWVCIITLLIYFFVPKTAYRTFKGQNQNQNYYQEGFNTDEEFVLVNKTNALKMINNKQTIIMFN